MPVTEVVILPPPSPSLAPGADPSLRWPPPARQAPALHRGHAAGRRPPRQSRARAAQDGKQQHQPQPRPPRDPRAALAYYRGVEDPRALFTTPPPIPFGDWPSAADQPGPLPAPAPRNQAAARAPGGGDLDLRPRRHVPASTSPPPTSPAGARQSSASRGTACAGAGAGGGGRGARRGRGCALFDARLRGARAVLAGRVCRVGPEGRPAGGWRVEKVVGGGREEEEEGEWEWVLFGGWESVDEDAAAAQEMEAPGERGRVRELARPGARGEARHPGGPVRRRGLVPSRVVGCGLWATLGAVRVAPCRLA